MEVSDKRDWIMVINHFAASVLTVSEKKSAAGRWLMNNN
jgi:hypothetical protein